MPGLSEYVRRSLADSTKLSSQLQHPLLVWSAAKEGPEEELLLSTLAGLANASARPTAAEPVVYELIKVPNKVNAFAMGVTVGRTGNNDIVLDDHSISRFHAWFRKDPLGTWAVVDAESKNGSWVDGTKLSPNASAGLKDGASVRFGEVELVFYEPASFLALVHKTRKKA